MKKIMAALALLALLSGCTAQGGGAASANWPAAWDWAGLAALAMAVMVLVLVVGYMAASVLEDDHLRAWVKRELGQAAYSAVILVVIVALASSMGGWFKLFALSAPGSPPAWNAYVNDLVCCDPAQQPCPQQGTVAQQRPCHIALAQDYLQILFEGAKQAGNGHLESYWFFSVFGNVGLGASLTALPDLASASIRPFAFLTLFSEYHGLMFDLAFKTMMFARAQQVFLELLVVAIFPVMMALGIVLRTLHFSRKLGGMLLALALSFYVIYPMFYVLMDAILFGLVGAWPPELGGTWPPKLGDKFDQSGTALPGTGGEVDVTGGADPFSRTVNLMDICGDATQEQKSTQESMLTRMAGQFGKAATTDWKHTGIGMMDPYFGPKGSVNTLASLMVFSMVAPFMGLMATLAAFKYFSPLLGGDAEISILSRLI